MLRIPAALGAVALSLALAGSAVAADPSSTTGKPKPAKKASKKGGKSKLEAKANGKGTRTEGAKPARTALTGDVKTQAEAAALAAVPGTVQGSYVAHTCPGKDASTSAAYEVDVLKADGTVVHVIEDASFAVIDQRTGGPKPPKPTATAGS